jgi:hypothetical protein
MTRILILLAGLLVVGIVGADSIPIKEEKEGLIGTYMFKGDFKESRNLVVELTISLNNAGQLIGHHRYKKQKSKGKWLYSIFTNYRRLSAREWTHEWKIKTLPGERCDKDRHCFVADQAFHYWSFSENKYKRADRASKRLSQFALDYQEVQNYSVSYKGHAGGLSSPYFRISESEVQGFVWCVIENTLTQTPEGLCTTHKGRVFATRLQAETETNIKWSGSSNASVSSTTTSTTAKTVQTTTAQPSTVEKTAEIEFWRSIQGSDDTDMYREYLRQFPSGVYAGLAKLKIKKLGGDTTVVNASIPNLDYGDYYALVIGNNNYQDLTNLRSAVNDAKVVSTVLEVDYGFNVKLLENASRKDILRSLKHLRETVSAKDNVLIYYAGHGYLDKDTDYGYWLPVDSERDDDSNWIATDRVVSQIKGMKAKHVMVVADSCFSGTITRAIKIEQRTPEWLSEIVKKKARTALTSGGLEPVMDTGSGNHSAFAYAFISLLEENDGVLDASQLFSKLRPKVMVNSTQTPQYGKIHMAGDDGGDFLFVRR